MLSVNQLKSRSRLITRQFVVVCAFGFFLFFKGPLCYAQKNWIGISEPFGLLKEESSGKWEFAAHNSRWTRCESFIYDVQWYHYQEPFFAGYAHDFKGGYFIVILEQEKQKYPRYKPNVEYFREEDWKERLEEMQFVEPPEWSLPEQVLLTISERERKPWRYSFMKGLGGLADDYWVLVFFVLAIIVNFVLGNRKTYLFNIRCRTWSFLIGTIFFITAVIISPPRFDFPVLSLPLWFIFYIACCYISECIGESAVKITVLGGAAILLATAAIVIHFGSLAYVGQAHWHHLDVLRGTEIEKAQAQKEKEICYVRAQALWFMGLGAAIGSIVCAIITYFRDGRTLIYPTAALLIVYLFMQFIMI